MTVVGPCHDGHVGCPRTRHSSRATNCSQRDAQRQVIGLAATVDEVHDLFVVVVVVVVMQNMHMAGRWNGLISTAVWLQVCQCV